MSKFCIKCGSSLDEQGLCIACQPPSGGDYPVEGVVTNATRSLLPQQMIYFDADMLDADGNGWVVRDDNDDESGIDCRFPTLAEAITWCQGAGFQWRVGPSIAYVPRRFTASELAEANDRMRLFFGGML